MKKVLFATVLLIAGVLFAQQQQPDYDGVKPATYKGSKALVFAYTPMQTDIGSVPIGSVKMPNSGSSGIYYTDSEVGGIGMKYYLKENMEVMVSLGFGSASSEEEFSSTDYYGNLVSWNEEASATIIGLSMDFNLHLKSRYSVSPYGGVNINIATISSTAETSFSTSGYINSKIEYSQTNFGLGLNLGFDWFFTEGMSLGGKYTLGYTSIGEPEYTDDTETVKGPSGSSLGTGTGTILLSVHF
ncbi:MAG: PorT family protein [Ignavibacteriales bacterium]|nr:PorT family protein [Ignavibacteriales bacterium]MCF8306535.1 PorT family protein [Ignavibacteriales bacterium]MCF8316334.1 PorT family protein [Ignavibacteriales bacterium]MCF8437708.1 PorT family protein [Ignavibacteriales bacterium]